MLSPSPTQQPPVPPVPEQRPERKDTSSIKKPGTSPSARFFKAIFRPLIKLLYYILYWTRRHKIAALLILLLCLLSATATNYFSTGTLPFNIGSDPFNFHVRGGNGGGDKVKNLLYAVRDGDSTTLRFIAQSMASPPQASALDQWISNYSQAKSGLSWKSINVMGVYSQPDSTIDSFVQVEVAASGPGGATKGYILWHFVTITGQGQEVLISAEPIDARAPLR